MKDDTLKSNTTPPFLYQETVEEEFVATIENIGGGFLACDAEWRIVYANTTAERLMGMPLDEVLGRNCWAVFPLMSGTPLEEEYRRAAAGETREFEHYYGPCDRWFHNRCFPRQGGGMAVYFYDITERKAAEEEIRRLNATLERQVAERTAALRFSEEKYRSLVETTTDCLWEVDPQGHFTYISPKFKEYTGNEPEDFLGRPPLEFLWEDCRHRYNEAFLALVAARQPFTAMEFPLRHLDGRMITVEVSGITMFSPAGEYLGMRGIARDITGRKEAEEKLRLSEEKYRSLVENTTDCIWETDPQGRFTYLSPGFQDVTGYSPADFLGKTPQDIIHGNVNAEQVREGLMALLAARQPLPPVERQLRHRDGRLVVVEVRAIPVFGPDGDYRGIRGITRDITGRKEAEERLRLSEEKYRSLVENTTDCIWETDQQGRFTYLSPRFQEQTGYPPEEFLGKTPIDLLPDNERNRFIEQFQAIVAARKPFTDIEHGVHRDGRVGFVEVSGVPFFSPEGDYLGLRGIGRDITERKYLEHELRRTRVSMDTVTDAIYWLTPDGRIVDVNPAACRIFGYPREQLLQLTIPDVDPNYNAEVWRQHFSELRERGSIKLESAPLDKDGRSVPLEIVANYVRFGEEELNCAVARDISERKRYERDLEQARDAAEAANRAKSRFLANMSHEIRTPLNGVIGMVQLMEFTDPTAEQQEYLDIIKKSSNTLLDLINDILDLSRIESGRVELEARDFRLRSTIADVISSQTSLINDKGLDVRIDIPRAVPDGLNGDQLRLKQVLLNLLGNAIKFTERGGIRVSVAVTERHDEIALLSIAVADTGIGISPEDIKTIFEPFFQADSSDSRKYGGTGLGLSICTRLADLMGGSLWVESSEGNGSTFYLQLPFTVTGAAVAHPDHRGSDRIFPQAEGAPLRILLVDDQEMNLILAKRLLQKAGHTVTEARDGREALEQWEQGEFDVVLMDVQMPVMNGVEATLAIRDRERSTGGHIPIIAVTARALSAEREHIQSQGFDGYVTKPFELLALLGEIKRCLGPV